MSNAQHAQERSVKVHAPTVLALSIVVGILIGMVIILGAVVITTANDAPPAKMHESIITKVELP